MGFALTVRIPSAGPNRSGIRINNVGGYAAGTTTAMTVDDVYATAGDATDIFLVGETVYAVNTAKASTAKEPLGIITAVTSTTIRIANSGGTKFALDDNADLFTDNKVGLATAKCKNSGATLAAASTNLEVSGDDRGNVLFNFYDFS